MLAPTGKVCLQTRTAITFFYILCVLQTTGSYNTTTYQTTPLLPRMLHSTLKASEKLVCKDSYAYNGKHMYKCTQGNQPTTVLHTKQNDHYTTKDASFVQVEVNYDFWSAAQYVNPFPSGI